MAKACKNRKSLPKASLGVDTRYNTSGINSYWSMGNTPPNPPGFSRFAGMTGGFGNGLVGGLAALSNMWNNTKMGLAAPKVNPLNYQEVTYSNMQPGQQYWRNPSDPKDIYKMDQGFKDYILPRKVKPTFDKFVKKLPDMYKEGAQQSYNDWLTQMQDGREIGNIIKQRDEKDQAIWEQIYNTPSIQNLTQLLEQINNSSEQLYFGDNQPVPDAETIKSYIEQAKNIAYAEHANQVFETAKERSENAPYERMGAVGDGPAEFQSSEITPMDANVGINTRLFDEANLIHQQLLDDAYEGEGQATTRAPGSMLSLDDGSVYTTSDEDVAIGPKDFWGHLETNLPTDSVEKYKQGMLSEKMFSDPELIEDTDDTDGITYIKGQHGEPKLSYWDYQRRIGELNREEEAEVDAASGYSKKMEAVMHPHSYALFKQKYPTLTLDDFYKSRKMAPHEVAFSPMDLASFFLPYNYPAHLGFMTEYVAPALGNITDDVTQNIVPSIANAFPTRDGTYYMDSPGVNIQEKAHWGDYLIGGLGALGAYGRLAKGANALKKIPGANQMSVINTPNIMKPFVNPRDIYGIKVGNRGVAMGDVYKAGLKGKVGTGTINNPYGPQLRNLDVMSKRSFSPFGRKSTQLTTEGSNLGSPWMQYARARLSEQPLLQAGGVLRALTKLPKVRGKIPASFSEKVLPFVGKSVPTIKMLQDVNFLTSDKGRQFLQTLDKEGITVGAQEQAARIKTNLEAKEIPDIYQETKSLAQEDAELMNFVRHLGSKGAKGDLGSPEVGQKSSIELIEQAYAKKIDEAISTNKEWIAGDEAVKAQIEEKIASKYLGELQGNLKWMKGNKAKKMNFYKKLLQVNQ